MGDFCCQNVKNRYNYHMLTKEEVLKLAKMARIALSDAEIEKFQKNLDTVLGYVEELKQVNTEGLAEVNQVTGLINVQRNDSVKDAQNHEEIFNQAPEMKDGYFKVKAIL